MPLKIFECPLCKARRETFKKDPKCNHNQEEEGLPHPLTPMTEVLSAPSTKFMEPRDPVAKEMGKSVPKDFNKVIKERARNHSRDNEMHDIIQTNDKNVVAQNKWVNADGTKRKKIDDL